MGQGKVGRERGGGEGGEKGGRERGREGRGGKRKGKEGAKENVCYLLKKLYLRVVRKEDQTKPGSQASHKNPTYLLHPTASPAESLS